MLPVTQDMLDTARQQETSAWLKAESCTLIRQRIEKNLIWRRLWTAKITWGMRVVVSFQDGKKACIIEDCDSRIDGDIQITLRHITTKGKPYKEPDYYPVSIIEDMVPDSTQT